MLLTCLFVLYIFNSTNIQAPAGDPTEQAWILAHKAEFEAAEEAYHQRERDRIATIQADQIKPQNIELHQELLNARAALENAHIRLDVDTILEKLIEYGKSKNKSIALHHLHAIKIALEKYKTKQYPNYFISWFIATPDIVKNLIQPAIDKTNEAINVLENNSNITPFVLIAAGTTAIATAAAGLYIWRARNKNQTTSTLPSDILAYYKTLGVPSNATKKEIEDRYVKLKAELPKKNYRQWLIVETAYQNIARYHMEFARKTSNSEPYENDSKAVL